ncbi:unnamed protein product [Amoebophrya sp. A120]|nr:unnamed protein product [Amoebophrya sp. A120]|eukprot:GSA120T00020912001.1
MLQRQVRMTVLHPKLNTHLNSSLQLISLSHTQKLKSKSKKLIDSSISGCREKVVVPSAVRAREVRSLRDRGAAFVQHENEVLKQSHQKPE